MSGIAICTGWPQFKWGVFIHPNNRMQAIRVVRVVEHLRGNLISIKEAAALVDSLSAECDGYIGPIHGYYDQETPASILYEQYRYYGMDVKIDEQEYYLGTK